jgi:hypothetical protein
MLRKLLPLRQPRLQGSGSGILPRRFVWPMVDASGERHEMPRTQDAQFAEGCGQPSGAGREIGMRGYVEMMERLAYFRTDERDPTDEEILAAMRDEYAARIDNAMDRAKEFGPEETK